MYHELVYQLLTRNHICNENDLPVWVIGDVHGCGDAFKKLVADIKKTSPNCIIFQLGDLIDRGPDVLSVFNTVQEHDIKTCIGNHELNFIQEWFGYKQCRSKARRETHDKIRSLPQHEQDIIIDGILKMQNYYTVEVSSAIWTLSHAPIRTEIDMFEDGGAGNTYCMSTTPYENNIINKDCVHGHMHWNYRDINQQIADKEQGWYNVDGGACYGGELIALELGSLQVIRKPGVAYATHSHY